MLNSLKQMQLFYTTTPGVLLPVTYIQHCAEVVKKRHKAATKGARGVNINFKAKHLKNTDQNVLL